MKPLLPFLVSAGIAMVHAVAAETTATNVLPPAPPTFLAPGPLSPPLTLSPSQGPSPAREFLTRLRQGPDRSPVALKGAQALISRMPILTPPPTHDDVMAVVPRTDRDFKLKIIEPSLSSASSR